MSSYPVSLHWLYSVSQAYKYEEYSADSQTIPGIVSTYKTHIVFVTVKALIWRRLSHQSRFALWPVPRDRMSMSGQ
jgi:hypothetical protein